MEASLPLDPCIMFPIDLDGHGSPCIVGANESFKGWDASLDSCK